MARDKCIERHYLKIDSGFDLHAQARMVQLSLNVSQWIKVYDGKTTWGRIN